MPPPRGDKLVPRFINFWFFFFFFLSLSFFSSPPTRLPRNTATKGRGKGWGRRGIVVVHARWVIGTEINESPILLRGISSSRASTCIIIFDCHAVNCFIHARDKQLVKVTVMSLLAYENSYRGRPRRDWPPCNDSRRPPLRKYISAWKSSRGIIFRFPRDDIFYLTFIPSNESVSKNKGYKERNVEYWN